MAKNKIPQDVKDAAGKIWLAGLGALSMAEEEGSKLFQNLVKKGETFEERGQDLGKKMKGKVDGARGKASETFERIESLVSDTVNSALARIGVPSKEDIEELTEKVEKLKKALENLATQKEAEAKAEAPEEKPKKTTTRKTTRSRTKSST